MWNTQLKKVKEHLIITVQPQVKLYGYQAVVFRSVSESINFTFFGANQTGELKTFQDKPYCVIAPLEGVALLL